MKPSFDNYKIFLEKLYQILDCLTSELENIVFKGGLIVKLILEENYYVKLIRQTKDIDATWIDNTRSTKDIAVILSSTLKKLDPNLEVVHKRDIETNQTAGFNIIDSISNQLIVKIDLDITDKGQLNSKTYSHRNLTIRGVLPVSILSDKISAISSEKIFRRTKDLVDVYTISNCVTIKLSEIFTYLEKSSNQIYTFDRFLFRQQELQHAYEKLKNIENKPEFQVIYSYLNNFLKPFIKHETEDAIWDHKNISWERIEENSEPRFRPS